MPERKDDFAWENDRHRDASPWRDWVINAYGKSLPFSKFIIWQLAGDLLPNATQEQIIATASTVTSVLILKQ